MREFSYPQGRQWQVWKVTPSATVYHERRAHSLAGSRAPLPYAGEERRKGDIQQGWLCFDSEAERRRFYPVPSGWEDFPDDRLVKILLASSPVRRLGVDV